MFHDIAIHLPDYTMSQPDSFFLLYDNSLEIYYLYFRMLQSWPFFLHKKNMIK